MTFKSGISSFFRCYLGFILFTQKCAADTSYVWLAGDDSFNLSSINQTAEKYFLWIFNTTIGHRIRISFLNFNFESGFTFLDIGDGTNVDRELVRYEDTSTYTRLASFSGADLPSVVTSVGNTAWIILRGSSREDWKQHFDMTVTPTDTSDITEIKEDEITPIKSMSYPSNYRNNFYRLWDIQAPQGFVISVIVRAFDIETGNDYLYIGDGVDRFTNQGEEWQDWTGRFEDEVLALRDFMSSTNSITMIFTTDFSTSRSGFWIQLQAIKIPAQITTTATATTTTVNPLISSASLSTSLAASQEDKPPYSTTPMADSSTFFKGILRQVLIFKWIAIISTSILILVITGCAFLLICRRWYHTRRDDKRYSSVTITSPRSHNQHLPMRDAQNDTELQTLPSRPYETIPELALHRRDTHRLRPASNTDDDRVDESGYMIPGRDDEEGRTTSITTGETVLGHRDYDTQVQRTYFDANTPGDNLGEFLPIYDSSIRQRSISLESTDKLSSSHYDSAEVLSLNRSAGALSGRLTEIQTIPLHINRPIRKSYQENDFASGNFCLSQTDDDNGQIIDSSKDTIGSTGIDEFGYLILDD